MARGPRYTYLIGDPTSGDVITEVPLSDVAFSMILNGCGQLTGTFPADAYFATEANFQDTLREITVLREGAPVWNGPITGLVGSRRGGWELTAREAIWYLQKRTVEQQFDFAAEDIYDILRDLVTYATSKTATGVDGMTLGDNINAALLNFAVAGGTAGVVKTFSLAGDEGYVIWDVINDFLISDPDNGIDVRMDYSYLDSPHYPTRTIIPGAPIGSQRDTQLRASDLFDYGRTVNFEDAATRITVRGKTGTVYKQNATSVGNGDLLLEAYHDHQDVSDADVLDALAKDWRHASKPPIHDRWVEWIPGKTLPWGWCTLGDQIRLDIDGPGLLQLTAQHRRLLQLDVTPPNKGARERVKGTLSIALDEVTV